jgi:hypothetical protein
MADSTSRFVSSTAAAQAAAFERDPSADELRRRVASRFRVLAASTAELRTELNERVRAAKDLKGRALRHPWWLAGMAGGAGLLTASILKRTRGPLGFRLVSLLAAGLVKGVAQRIQKRATEGVDERRLGAAWRR